VNQVRGCEGTALLKRLWAAGYEKPCVGLIGRLTEVILIPAGCGRMRIVSPHELPVGDV